MNNFQRLLEEQSSQYEGTKKQKVQQNLLHTFGIFKFVGHLIDVYLPAMVDVIISSMGGKADNDEGRGGSASGMVSRNPPPDLGGDGHPGKSGPESPGLDELR